jgi:hypothetical protein
MYSVVIYPVEENRVRHTLECALPPTLSSPAAGPEVRYSLTLPAQAAAQRRGGGGFSAAADGAGSFQRPPPGELLLQRVEESGLRAGQGVVRQASRGAGGSGGRSGGGCGGDCGGGDTAAGSVQPYAQPNADRLASFCRQEGCSRGEVDVTLAWRVGAGLGGRGCDEKGGEAVDGCAITTVTSPSDTAWRRCDAAVEGAGGVEGGRRVWGPVRWAGDGDVGAAVGWEDGGGVKVCGAR